jgi:hypothetical protein
MGFHAGRSRFGALTDPEDFYSPMAAWGGGEGRGGRTGSNPLPPSLGNSHIQPGLIWRQYHFHSLPAPLPLVHSPPPPGITKKWKPAGLTGLKGQYYKIYLGSSWTRRGVVDLSKDQQLIFKKVSRRLGICVITLCCICFSCKTNDPNFDFRLLEDFLLSWLAVLMPYGIW